MKIQVELLLLIIFPSIVTAKFVIEPCNSSDTCNSLLSYLLPWDSKLSEVAQRFQVNVSDIIASNELDPSQSLADTQILPAKTLIKVPISCSCVDGIRRSVSTTYRVQAADTLDSISVGYGGLVSAEQLKSVNGIDGKHRLVSGQSLVIPLPCTCFNNSSNGVAAVYMSYVVQSGESLSSIGAAYGMTVRDLEAVNMLANAAVDPGDILAVPIPACSSANLNWRNESLIVPNGSYALTANNCIKCTCGTSDLNLGCSPSAIATSCSHLQCKGTHLFIGDADEKQLATGCNVTKCVYRGHSGRKIFRSLQNSFQGQCSGNESHSTLSPSASPKSHSSVNPLVNVPPPSSSPTSTSNRSVPIVASDPTNNRQGSSIPSDGESLRDASSFGIFLFELVLLAIFGHLLAPL